MTVLVVNSNDGGDGSVDGGGVHALVTIVVPVRVKVVTVIVCDSDGGDKCYKGFYPGNYLDMNEWSESSSSLWNG